MPVVGPRFLIEAGFIITVAVIAGIARLDTVWIVAVMAGAWLIVAVVEITVSRRRAKERGRPGARVPVRPAEPPAASPSPVVVRREPRVEARPEPPAPAPREEPRIEPRPEPSPTLVVPTPPVVVVPPPPEPEPEPEPTQEQPPPAEPAPTLGTGG